MPTPQPIYDYWTKRYMNVLLSGYKAFPQEIGDGLAMEERAGFLRGMMVEAGKSGLIPTASEVIELLKDAPAAETKPIPLKETTETTKADKKPSSEAFDRNKPGWVCCPECASTDIKHPGKNGKKPYYACFECQIFLNIDDKSQPVVKPMGAK